MAKSLEPEMTGCQILTLKGTDRELGPYLNLIYQTWKMSLRYGNEWFQLIDDRNYFETYNRLIPMILERPETRVNLAVLSDDPDVCLGWSVYEGNTLHYVFVKGDPKKDPEGSAKRRGIGTRLIPKGFDTVTHLTLQGLSIWKRKYPEVAFKPF